MSEEQQGLDGGGQPITAPDLEALDTRESILDPVVLRYTVMTYLVVLPVGHLYSVSVFGAMATLSDFFSGHHSAGRVRRARSHDSTFQGTA